MFAHNVETVPRIFKRIRPAFRYERSLDVLTQARDAGLITKSNLILGMGEERARDQSGAAATCTTPAPTSSPSRSTCGRRPRHLPVARWVRPEEFVEIKEEAEEIGFLGVLAGPLVRSSYRAGRLWARSMHGEGTRHPGAPAASRRRELGFAQAVS